MHGKFKTKNQQLKLLREKNVNTPDGSAKILLESNYNELIKNYIVVPQNYKEMLLK